MPRINRSLLYTALICALLAACSGPAWVAVTPQALNTAFPAPAASPTPPPPTPAPELPTSAPQLPPPQPEQDQPTPEPDGPLPAAQYVVLIALDGFRPDYLTLTGMPNLQALISAGTSYTDAWVGAMPNNTPPGHVMMVTGSLPRRSGIIGHTWANLQSGESFTPFTLEAVQAGEADTMVESSGVPTLAGLIKDRYPDDMVAALSAQKFYAAQCLGLGPTDVLLYASGTDEDAYSLPQMAQLEALRGRVPPEDFLSDPDMRTSFNTPGDANAFALRAAARLFERFRPRALLINLPETDYYGHIEGGFSTPNSLVPVLDRTDAALGDLIQSYRVAGVLDQTVWVIAADHGMTPKGNILVPADLYAEMDVSMSDADQPMLPEARLAEPGRAPQVAAALAVSGAPGLTGAYALVQQDGRYTYQAAPATAGSLPAALNDSYLYLLDTYASAYSPNVVVTTAGRTAYDEQAESSGGTHNPLNWDDQHVLLVFSGAGVSPGRISSAPARLVDILPTLARLLDLRDDNMDGIPLADALAVPLPEDAQRQDETNAFLAPLRDALAATAGE